MARERGLYRRKDSRFWWIGLVLSDGRRVCQSTGCINRTDAESYVVRLKNEAIEAKQQGLLGIFVWQQAVMRYLEEFADKRSLSDDKDHLKKLDPYLRSLKVDAIDMTVLQPFIRDRKLKDGVSNATVNRALEVVRRILNVAHQDWRWLKGVPTIRMLKEPRRRVRFLRREEADRLIEALPNHMKPIVEFALSTGCRAGEILGLEWSRVDLNRKVAWLDHGTTIGRRSWHPFECRCRGSARSDAGTTSALVLHLRR
jgi:integrase